MSVNVVVVSKRCLLGYREHGRPTHWLFSYTDSDNYIDPEGVSLLETLVSFHHLFITIIT